MLNIPNRFEEDLKLDENPNILLIGSGGGFDVVSCLPLYYTLRYKGFHPHIANYTMSDVSQVPSDETIIINNDIRGSVAPKQSRFMNHYPEGLLSQWFKTSFNEDIPIWMIRRQAVKGVSRALFTLCKKFDITKVVMCGYGMRTIMVGDEADSGMMLWPSVMLAALKPLELDVKIMTLGVNTTPHPNTESFNSALKNIGGLIKAGAYYGGCFLEKQMDSFEYYKSGYDFIASSDGHDQDPMHETLLTAVFGGHGRHKDGGMVYPNLAQCHFFQSGPVIDQNMVIPTLEGLDDYDEMFQMGMKTLASNPIKRDSYPLEM